MSVSPVSEIVPRALYPRTREALRVDDNPLELPVSHSTDIADDPTHRCAPRILAECCICHEQLNLCDATGADVDRLIAQMWRCEACRVD